MMDEKGDDGACFCCLLIKNDLHRYWLVVIWG